MFRISLSRNDTITVASLDEIGPALRAARPGRYVIDRIEQGVSRRESRSQRWGVGVKTEDGSVWIEIDPLEE